MVSGNTAGSDGGGISMHGGLMLILGSRISGNTSERGGGIFNDGQLIICTSTITANHSGSVGGGIFNDGSLTVIDSIVRHNFALLAGGGIAYHKASAAPTIIASVVADNANGDITVV
jgi:predicted outer membrane repeat protein